MRVRMCLVPTAVFFVILVVGCGGDSASETGAQEPTSVNTPVAATPAGSSTIQGTVHFEGTPPERRPIRQVRECEALHQEPVLTDNVVVNDNSTLKWTFVYVKEGLEGREFPTPQEPVILDQQDCMYTPHVFGVQTGQPIKILNSDPLSHNIHALPEENRPFNFGMPNQGDERERVFQEPEVMVRIKCDIHPWMLGWAGVLSHPYYSVTGDDGTFNLQNLPAGQYVIEAWHEEYGTQTQTITIGDGETQTIDFTFGQQA